MAFSRQRLADLDVGLHPQRFGSALKTVPATVGATGRYLWQRLGQEHIPASGVPECGGGPLGVGSQRLKRCRRGDRTQQRQGGAQAAQAHAQLMDAFWVTTILGCRLVRQHVDMSSVEDSCAIASPIAVFGFRLVGSALVGTGAALSASA